MLGHCGVMMESSRKLESLLYISFLLRGIAENVLNVTFLSSVLECYGKVEAHMTDWRYFLGFTSFML